MGILNDLFGICAVTILHLLAMTSNEKKILFKKEKKNGIRTSAYLSLNVKALNRSTTSASIVLAILQRYQIRIARQFL